MVEIELMKFCEDEGIFSPSNGSKQTVIYLPPGMFVWWGQCQYLPTGEKVFGSMVTDCCIFVSRPC